MKPKKDEHAEWDIRLTPQDQREIEAGAWSILQVEDDEDERILACKEGGTESLRLHYHMYYKTRNSKSHIITLLKRLSGGSGNPAFSMRKAHNGTIGYVVKDKDVVYRHHYTDTHLDEYFRISDQYRRDGEAARKRDTRTKHSTLKLICDNIRKSYETDELTPSEIYKLIDDEYQKRQMNLPTRSVLEVAIINLSSAFRRREYYLKNLV